MAIFRMLVNERNIFLRPISLSIYLCKYKQKKIQLDWLGPFLNSFVYAIFTSTHPLRHRHCLLFSHDIWTFFVIGLLFEISVKNPVNFKGKKNRRYFFFLICWHWKFHAGGCISSRSLTPLTRTSANCCSVHCVATYIINKADKGCRLLLSLTSSFSDFLS